MKHGVIVVSLLILTLCLIGAVSANENITAIDDNNQILQTQEESQMQSITNDLSLEESETISSSEPQIKDSVLEVSSSEIIYEEDNSEKIINDDENNLLVNKVDEVDENNISQPDLHSDIQTIEVNITFENDYQMGYEITRAVDNLVNFKSCSNILAITTFQSKINNKTSKDILNGIINASNGYVNYDNGNLLTLSSINTDFNIAYFIQKNESSSLVYYTNNGLLLYSGDLSLESFNEQYELFNYWINQSSRPIYSGVVCDESEIQNYPQGNKFNLLLENTRNILGDSRNSSNDAFIWNNENDSDKNAYVGVDQVNNDLTRLNLNNANETEEVSNSRVSQEQLEQIGIDASKMALAYFKSMGIDIPKGYSFLYILTSAGYVKLNESSTGFILNGISDTLGSILFDNLIPIHTSLWKDLVFYFLWVDSTDETHYMSYALVYDSVTGRFTVSNTVKQQGDKTAYNLGLYEYPNNNKKQNNNHKHSTNKLKSTTKQTNYSISNGLISVDSNLNSALNTTVKTDNSKNNGSSNVTAFNTPDFLSIVANGNFNMFNVLATLTAIVLVFMVFSVGYLRN